MICKCNTDTILKRKEKEVAVKIDVTGFFYRRKLDVDIGFQTVKEALQAARLLSGPPFLDFTGETSSVIQQGALKEVEFLKSFIITHENESAVSGQTSGTNPRRYANGIYVGADDAVIFPKGDPTKGLVSPEGKKIINAWQYYVYEEIEVDGVKKLVDVNRSMGSRRVEPYSEPFLVDNSGNARGILPNDTIVWRQVSIAIEPTFPLVASV